MAPIRVAIIGLSPDASIQWASNAHLPYLLSPEGKAKFEIVALLNSTVDAAEAAVRYPAALAADSEVDFVVNATRVDIHYETILPSLIAGKDVYVEWPLVDTLDRTIELAEVAHGTRSRTVVGLQGWFAPAVLKVKEMIVSGRIGSVVGSEVRAAGGRMAGDVIPIGLRYFTERKAGGNAITIGLGHLLDFVQFVLGDIQDASHRLQIQHPEIKLLDPSTKHIVEVVQSDVPDLVYLTGALPASEYITSGASFNLSFRRGPPVKGEPPLVWDVFGTKGTLRLVAESGAALQLGGDPIAITVYDSATADGDKVWSSPEGQEATKPSKAIGAMYEAYASGDQSTYPDFDHAVKRRRQLEHILTGFYGNLRSSSAL
ncbi:NAD(P)-binding protein [Thozetella sp. PMI_491]|nr:NAD(P)-binding protein [Thozetella sp. PMI_491]